MTEPAAHDTAITTGASAEAAVVIVDDARLAEDTGPARSLTSDAWRQLRRTRLFWVSAVLIAFFLLMAAVPTLFTHTDPTAADLLHSVEEPSSTAWFGYDLQGRDILARCIHAARASVMVGVITTVFTSAVGSIIGVIAGYFGGWIDALLSRLTDIVFAIPLLLGGILFLTSFPSTPETPYLLIVLKVVVVLMAFGWPPIARLMRSAVLQVKGQEYVLAARALGASPWRIITSHVLPNALAPVIVVSTINLGAFIVAESVLSFLGIGLQPPAISWGTQINEAVSQIYTSPHVLLFPSLFLSLCVLAFILLGDAVRDAFDPRTR